jgi:hypothetical protein
VTIYRDATKPTVSIVVPASGATYTQNTSVASSFACSDLINGLGSGVKTCTGNASLDTSSTGTKSFAATATDNAGNSTTATVSYNVQAAPPPPVASAATQVLAWNDLGMHCADSDYSVFTLLPPFNTLNAQLIVGGKRVDGGNYTLTYQSMADPTGSINTYSGGKGNNVPKKTNFWDYVLSLFGGQPPDNVGLTGNPTASTAPANLTWSTGNNWFEATGIPITPFDDKENINPFPLVKVTALSSSGQPIASTSAVLPVSSEINCNTCHASGTVFSATQPTAKPAGGWVNQTASSERDWRLNVLRLHDEKNRANATYASLLTAKGYGSSLETSVTVNNKPIFCDTCHNSTALAIWGLKGEPATTVSNMTVAMHTRHAGVSLPGQTQTLDQNGTRDACYNCHPGKDTQCLRGAMGNPVVNGKHEMECQSCHGSMSTVASTARRGWLDMPTCQSCHQNGQRGTTAINPDGTFKTASDTRFASNPNTPTASNSPPPVNPGDAPVSLYRYSVGHGKLQCESCHNSTHAEFTNIASSNGNQVNDNLRAIAFQGYDAALRECTGCHGTTYSTDDTASANGGPHGMHSVGQAWVNKHHDLISSSGGLTNCQYCHSSTSVGSPLATVKIAKTFNVGDGRTKAFKANDPVTCYSCHNGPNPG